MNIVGGTESLASLPASMTTPAFRLTFARNGIEHPSDLIADIAQALNEA
jgi:methionine-gamma-lyase